MNLLLQPDHSSVRIRVPVYFPRAFWNPAYPCIKLATLPQPTRVLRSESLHHRSRRVSDPSSPIPRGGPFPPPTGSPLTPSSSPSSPLLGHTRLAAALLITPPATTSTAPRVPPPLPPRSQRPPLGSQAPPLNRVFPDPVPSTPQSLPTRAHKQNTAMDLRFSGDRDKQELSAANFIKQLNILYRTNGTTEPLKFIDVADRFEDQSPADKWYTALKNATPQPAAATDWDAFRVAFVARFKGADPVLKPRAQLEADLSRMRIGIGALAAGTVEVRGRQVYVLADFVERLGDAIVEADASAKDVGLWDFHAALPPVLQDAVGAMPANWAAMVTALGAVPQTKVALAVADYKEKKASKEQVESLAKRVGALSITPGASRITPPSSAAAELAAAAAVVAAPAAPKGRRTAVVATAEMKEHPNTAAGLAAYEDDCRRWFAKFGTIARQQLKLEITGYPLKPGVPSPCTNECWRCGYATTPNHDKTNEGCGRQELPLLETALRSLGGTWLGRTNLQAAVPVQHVAVEPVVVMGPWWGADAAVQSEQEDFGEGLQQ
ncbi:hypothetical protein DFH09DRAFT_1508801 [Mycena vulgaris]|nr:hypothetical protein DFH09DRAFT_1508801 [Mycena vulgaris]